MTIKSIQTLVNSAMKQIKTINANEAYKMHKENNCNLIDLRDIRELQNQNLQVLIQHKKQKLIILKVKKL